jgi:hypothetical protein
LRFRLEKKEKKAKQPKRSSNNFPIERGEKE